MATIGLDKLYYAPIEEDVNGNENYGTPIKLAKAITANLTVNAIETQLTADGECIETITMFDCGKISLEIDELGTNATAALLGAKVDCNGVVICSKEDSPKPVAIGFRARKADGTYKYVWLYRVLFGLPANDAATKGDNITYTTQKIEGLISRRKKKDYNGDHPWKAELNEDYREQNILTQANSVSPVFYGSTEKLSSGYRINKAGDDAAGLAIKCLGWFNSVYEPNRDRPWICDTETAVELEV